jgi:ABC-type enterobactin transport system permease subunit
MVVGAIFDRRRVMVKLPALVLLSALASSTVATATPGPLPFIADDFAAARARARNARVPLFVEVGAPW